jgi:predicted N-acetyltransferase YhbS
VTPEGLAALCANSFPAERLSVDEIATCCFGPDTVVLGDEQGAVVLTVKEFGPHVTAWIVLLAVNPERQGQGRGRDLVEAAATRARELGAADLHLGNVAPRYVWPGVDFTFTRALTLFEAAAFEPYGAECNMAIDTAFRALLPGRVEVTREVGDDAIALARHDFPNWADEVARAVERGTCFAARDEAGVIGFACHSVNRRHWIGPMATSADRRRGGVGNALLAAVCEDIAAAGTGTAEIAWVGPVGFYARAGARVSRVFRTARRSL